MLENEGGKKLIEQLFSILVNHYLSSHKPLTFKYNGNLSQGGLVNITRCQSEKYFSEAADKTGWIEGVLTQVVSNLNPK